MVSTVGQAHMEELQMTMTGSQEAHAGDHSDKSAGQAWAGS